MMQKRDIKVFMLHFLAFIIPIQVCIRRYAAHRRHLDGRQHGGVEPPRGLRAHVPLTLHRRTLILRRREPIQQTFSTLGNFMGQFFELAV